MDEREPTATSRRRRWSAIVRIAFTLAALTPCAAAGQEHSTQQLMPASSARVAAIAEGEPPKVAEEWERLRRHHAHR